MAHTRTLPEFEKFDASMHPGNELKAFNLWLRRFENRYTVVTTVAVTAVAAAKEADKRAWLLNYLEDNVLDNLEALYDTKALWDAATYTDIITKYKAQLKPNQTLTLMRHRFYRMFQGDEEDFNTFASRVKREVAYCEFSCAADTSTITRDQIVKGVRLERIRDGALKNDWSLEDTIKNGRRIEFAHTSVKELRSSDSVNFPDYRQETPPKGEPVNAVDAPRNKNVARQKQKACFMCGMQCKGEDRCFAHGKRCNYCSKPNHFESVCMRKKKGIPPPRGKKNPTNYVTVGEDSDSAEETINTKGKRSLPIHAISEHGSGLPKTVEVVVHNEHLQTLPDSGSKVNVIPICCLPKALIPQIQPTKSFLSPYKSDPIYPIGKIRMTTSWGNKQYFAKWYVVESDALGSNTPLLGCKVSEALGIIVFNTTPQGTSVSADSKHMSIQAIRVNSHKQQQGSKPAQQPPHQLPQQHPPQNSSIKGDPNGPLNIPENMEALKDQYKHVFGRGGGLGKLNNRQLHLYPKDNVKPRIAPYRPVPVHLEARVNKEIDAMLKDDIVEEVTGPVEWCSNLVIVPKPETDEIRVVADLRAVNHCLQNTHKPIPSIETIKTKFSNKTVFSKIDFKSAFHQIEVDEESRKFLVFRVGDRLLRYKRMTMGLLPASGEFMDMVAPQFSDIEQSFMIHDDTTIAGLDQKDHDNGVRNFLQRADDLGLTLKESKCVFSKPEIPFWGLIVSKDGLRPNPLKVQTLHQQVTPQNKQDLISFLAMVRANDNFIPNIAAETALLRQLTKKGVRFRWTEEHEAQFQRVKELFNERILLKHFDINLPTYLFVDASVHGFGAILCQGPSIDNCSPVDVASRSTRGAEPRYPQIDLEAMAIDFALQRFRFFLVGSPQVSVITDHKPLVPIFAHTRRGSTRCEKIKLRNQDIDFIVKYQKGKTNMSDYFSRHPVPFENLEPTIQTESDEHGKLLYSLSRCSYTKSIPQGLISEESDKDKTLRRLKLAIHLGYCPPDDPVLKPYKKVFDELSVIDDIIYRGDKVVLPDSLQEVAIDNAHQGGHPGSARLKSLIRTYYWFPEMNTLIEQWVQSCDCQLYNKDRLKNPITSAPTPVKPWDNVSADLFGPMPNDEHILLVRDNLSRFPAAEIVRSTAAKDVIPAMDKIYTDFGTPVTHKTDNGPPFNSSAFEDYSKDNNISHKRIPPLHPQSNEAECTMKPLGKAMKMAHHNKLNKKHELNKFLKQYRATPHPSTTVAPGDVIFRAGYSTGHRRPAPPIDIVEKVKKADATAKNKNEGYVNNKRFTRRRRIVKEQLVLLLNDFKQRKFDPYYEKEPYVVVNISGELLHLQRRSDGRALQRHVSHTKPFFPRRQPASDYPRHEIEDSDHLGELDDESLSGESTPQVPNIPVTPPVEAVPLPLNALFVDLYVIVPAPTIPVTRTMFEKKR